MLARQRLSQHSSGTMQTAAAADLSATDVPRVRRRSQPILQKASAWWSDSKPSQASQQLCSSFQLPSQYQEQEPELSSPAITIFVSPANPQRMRKSPLWTSAGSTRDQPFVMSQKAPTPLHHPLPGAGSDPRPPRLWRRIPDTREVPQSHNFSRRL